MKLNSRLKKQYISDIRPIAITVKIKSSTGIHEETMSFIDLISYSRKHGLSDRLTYPTIFEQVIKDWNKSIKGKNDQRKIIQTYEVYESKLYIKL